MSRIGTVASAAAAAAVLAFLLTSLPAQPARASAAAKPAPLTWMAKTADIARVAAYFGGLSPAVPVPAFGWHLCGGPYNDKCPVPLAAGDVPVMASEAAMRAMARHGFAGLVMYDQEGGQPGHPWTPPAELADRLGYICRAARLQVTDPQMKVIIAPFDSALAMSREDIEAARCGAYAVAIQTQFASGDPSGTFQPFLMSTMAQIRQVSKAIRIGFGLSTNGPAGPAKVWNEVRDYRYAVADGVQMVWFNAPDWAAKSKCPATDRGCAYIDYRLWTDLGLVTP